MGFTAMEHYVSTLATTATAVLGLVVAAHVLHPRTAEDQPRPRAIATVAAPTAWVDPPAGLGVASLAGSADAAALLAPRVTMVLPPDVAMTKPLASALVPLDRAPRAESHARRRTAQRERRVRHAALERPAVAPVPGAAVSGSPAPQTDPIGDLIRGLGLDG